MLKVIVEWDETSQACRLRRGLITVDGVMPGLVSWVSIKGNSLLACQGMLVEIQLHNVLETQIQLMYFPSGAMFT